MHDNDVPAADCAGQVNNNNDNWTALARYIRFAFPAEVNGPTTLRQASDTYLAYLPTRL